MKRIIHILGIICLITLAIVIIITLINSYIFGNDIVRVVGMVDFIIDMVIVTIALAYGIYLFYKLTKPKTIEYPTITFED